MTVLLLTRLCGLCSLSRLSRLRHRHFFTEHSPIFRQDRAILPSLIVDIRRKLYHNLVEAVLTSPEVIIALSPIGCGYVVSPNFVRDRISLGQAVVEIVIALPV